MSDNQIEVQGQTPGWIAPAVVVLALLSIGGLGLAWHDSTELQSAEQGFGTQMKTAQATTAQQLTALEQKLAQSDATTTGVQSDLGVVTKKLRVTQGELKQARTDAAQIREESSEKLAQMDTDVNNKLATKASTDDLTATNTSVTGVKTDLDGTKNDLKMARSELGTLIARNHEEIDVLRHMGERDYTEFSVTKNKPGKVGNFTVELHSVNAKKNQFTVSLVVDDVKTEKKNRTVNEPVIFYPNGSHQADELVVNQVGKDKISGYISVPKASGTTTTASGN